MATRRSVLSNIATLGLAASTTGTTMAAAEAQGAQTVRGAVSSPRTAPASSPRSLKTVQPSNGTVNVGDLAAGTEPLEREEASWANTRRNFEALYKVLADGAVKDDDIQGVGPGIALRFTDYDLLLDEAGALLERCLQARAEYQEKLSKAFNLLYEYEEFIEMDAIHSEEVKGDGAVGIYTVQAAASRAEVASLEDKLAAAQTARSIYENIQEEHFSDKAADDIVGAEQLLAFANGSREKITWNKGSPQFAYDAVLPPTELVVNRTIQIQRSYNYVQLSSAVSLVKSTISSLAGARAKLNWDVQDIEFKRRRTQAARAIAEKKIAQATLPGGAYNYAEQLSQLRRRVARDFVEAKQHLLAVSDGLKTIFGRSDTIPKLDVSGLFTSFTLDEAYRWATDASTYLRSTAKREQRFTQTLSLKSVMGNDFFRKAPPWIFAIDEKFFPNLRNVRLKGINAFAVGSSGVERIFLQAKAGTSASFSVQAPKESFYCWADAAGTKAAANQTDVPIVRIGKVGTRESFPYYEVYGANVLRNISPIGIWSLKLDYDGRAENLKDIVLDLELVARSYG
jgi:hypothetical protein